MEQVSVTYSGPSAAYSVEYDGEWFEFERGRELVVPERLAERLLDVRGHTFEVGDEVEVEGVANEQGTERFSLITDSGSGSGSGSGDGPAGVNAA